MKKIKVTVELTKRYYQEIDLPEDVYKALIRGDIDERDIATINWKGLFDTCRERGLEETNYTILDEEDRTIVPWN